MNKILDVQPWPLLGPFNPFCRAEIIGHVTAIVGPAHVQQKAIVLELAGVPSGNEIGDIQRKTNAHRIKDQELLLSQRGLAP